MEEELASQQGSANYRQGPPLRLVLPRLRRYVAMTPTAVHQPIHAFLETKLAAGIFYVFLWILWESIQIRVYLARKPTTCPCLFSLALVDENHRSMDPHEW